MAYEEFMEALKEELLKKRAELRANIDNELNELRGEEGHHLADMEDLASDTSDSSAAFQILELEAAEFEEIDLALEKIDEGTYGLCEECGETIGLERLKALPFATLCIDCKRREERFRR